MATETNPATVSPVRSTTPSEGSKKSSEPSRLTADDIRQRFPGIANGTSDERSQELLERHSRQDVARREARIVASIEELSRAVGARYAECTLANFHSTTHEHAVAVDKLRKFIFDLDDHLAEGNGLLLAGPVGTGKDHLMVAVAREAIARGASLAWVNGLEFFAGLRDAIGDDRSESDLVRALCKPQVLCLSDPIPPIVAGNDRSRGTLTDFQAQSMFRLIDRRYRDRKPTWATLNVSSSQDLAERISGPIYDRLRDGAVTVTCNWPSYRKAR